MRNTLRLQTTVLAGNRLEIASPELPEGAQVEVFVVLREEPITLRRSMLEFVESLPPGPMLFKTPDEANRHIEAERDAWDR